MIDDIELFRAIRHDIRTWPGGRSIHDDYEPDIFAPTTIAVVAEACGLPADHPLLVKAQTSEWSADAAEKLIDLLIAHLIAGSARYSDAQFLKHVRYDAAGAAAAATKNKRLSVMQQAVLDAAKEAPAEDKEGDLSDRLLARGTAAKIARRLNRKYPTITSSYVSKRIEAMRDKGLLPPQRDDA